MSRTVCAAALAAGLAGAASSSAVAADAAPAETEIHLSEQATRTLTPDRLRAILRVEAKGNNGRDVQAEVNRRMAAALAKAKGREGVTAETGGYSVNRDFSIKSGAAWVASETLTVSSKDFSAVLTLVGELQGDGMLTSGLQFYLAPGTLKSAESELTAAALAALRARAQEVATDLGMVVDRYKSITIGNAAEGSRPMPMLRFATQAMAAPAPPVAEPGDETVSLTVEADILLAAGKT
jgi:predicted secreted protein